MTQTNASAVSSEDLGLSVNGAEHSGLNELRTLVVPSGIALAVPHVNSGRTA
jgi:hypothetical protein